MPASYQLLVHCTATAELLKDFVVFVRLKVSAVWKWSSYKEGRQSGWVEWLMGCHCSCVANGGDGPWYHSSSFFLISASCDKINQGATRDPHELTNPLRQFFKAGHLSPRNWDVLWYTWHLPHFPMANLSWKSELDFRVRNTLVVQSPIHLMRSRRWKLNEHPI